MADLLEMVRKMATKKEPWRSRGDRAMVRGDFSICKYGLPPNEVYALFGAGPEMLAKAKTYQELMAKVDQL